MIKNLPIDLPVRSMTTKISVGAQARLKERAAEHGVRMSDVLSACVLYMDEDRLAEILAEQKAVLDSLPKWAKGLLRNVETLSDEEREMLREIFS